MEDVDFRLGQIEQQLEGLRNLYEQHFAGVLKRIPVREHDQFKAALKSILPHELKSTAMRFRHQGIQTRHLQMSNRWAKVLREIEEGTYKRDLFLMKAKEHAAPAPTESPAAKKSGFSSQLEKLYEKYSEMAVAQKQKIPEKASFIKALQSQIETQKAKHPQAKIELKLQKDEGGKYQVKLKVTR